MTLASLGLVWACSSVTPSSPSPSGTAPAPIIQLGIAPAPVTATVIGSTSDQTTYRVQGTVTFTESGGTAAHITQLVRSVVFFGGNDIAVSQFVMTLPVDIHVPARGEVSAEYSQDFPVTPVVAAQSADQSLKLSGQGVDEFNRPFTTQDGWAAIALPSAANSLFRTRLWAMVVDESGVCIAGATVRVVGGQALGQSMTQTPCDVWAYDGGVVFKDLIPGVAMTLRATAPGFNDQDKTVVPTTGPQMAVIIAPSRKHSEPGPTIFENGPH